MPNGSVFSSAAVPGGCAGVERVTVTVGLGCGVGAAVVGLWR